MWRSGTTDLLLGTTSCPGSPAKWAWVVIAVVSAPEPTWVAALAGWLAFKQPVLAAPCLCCCLLRHTRAFPGQLSVEQDFTAIVQRCSQHNHISDTQERHQARESLSRWCESVFMPALSDDLSFQDIQCYVSFYGTLSSCNFYCYPLEILKAAHLIKLQQIQNSASVLEQLDWYTGPTMPKVNIYWNHTTNY